MTVRRTDLRGANFSMPAMPRTHPVRAVVVGRERAAAAALAAALADAADAIAVAPPVTVEELGAALERGGDVVVCGPADADATAAVVATARAAGAAVVLTDPAARPPDGDDVAVEPDPGRLAETVVREHAAAEGRRAAGRARRLLAAQRAIADRLSGELTPQELLGAALAVVSDLLDAPAGVAWEADARGALHARAAVGDAVVPAEPAAPGHVARRAAERQATDVADGAVALPLVAGGRAEGVLELRLGPGRALDEALAGELPALAGQIAMHLRHRRGAALLELHERALAATNNGIVMCDLADDGGWPVSFVNEAFEQLTGYRAEEVLGRSLSLLQGPETDPEAVAEMRAALRAGEECWVTLRNYRRDGSPFWNEVYLTPVADDDGVVRRYIGIMHDVTARVSAAVELEETESRYRTLVETIPAITYIAEWDELGTFAYVSPQVEELLGWPPEAWLGGSSLWEDRIHPDDRERVLAAARAAYREERSFDCEFRMLARDGRVLWMWERDTVIRDEDGRPRLTQGIVTDVTAIRAAEAALAESEERSRAVIEALEEGLLVYGADGRVISGNAAAARIFGVASARDLLGMRIGEAPLTLTFEDGSPVTDETAPSSRAFATGRPQLDVVIRCRRADGVELWASVSSHPLMREGEARPYGVVSAFSDITERRRAQEQIAFLAYHDALTRLPNRALLDEHLALALARARRHGRSVALLYVDLDHFKAVNDSLGHAAGDELLKLIAARLRGVVRSTDLLARQGGDEFLILLTDLEGNPRLRAEATAKQVELALLEPFQLADAEFEVGASIGISIYPDDAHDADTLLRHADAAMYEVKQAGRGGIASFGGDSHQTLARLSLTSKLRRALQRDDFVVHYQPIVSPATGGLVAFEALVRWQDAERGVVGPNDFIPLAEDAGLIEAIGGWVLNAVCAQLRAWCADGLLGHVHVNVSPRQLRRPDFPTTVLNALDGEGLGPELLTLEITETAAMLDADRASPVVLALHDAGLRLAIDDFGSGHSSLARLRDVPVDVLKIDQAFLRGVPADRQASAMLTAIIELGGALGMTVVAEGVTSDAQRRFLVDRGCPLAQGFHFARPLTAAEATAALRALVAPEAAG